MAKKKKKIIQQQGNCPKCGSDLLDYDAAEINDGGVVYPYTCGNCSFEGREWYNMEFSEHRTSDGKEIK